MTRHGSPDHPPDDAPLLARVPRLATARLLLREPRRGDFEAFAADVADPAARAHIAPPMDRRAAWGSFLAQAGYWLLEGTGWWTVEEKDLGWVGSVGVFRRETGPALEIGWFIHRAHWNKGYASEAARAALDWAVSALGARRVIAHIAKANAASIKVATKIGMRLEGEGDFYGEVDWLYVFEARAGREEA
jgi:RimJ/RimL family protein N-acetyltransferase